MRYRLHWLGITPARFLNRYVVVGGLGPWVTGPSVAQIGPERVEVAPLVLVRVLRGHRHGKGKYPCGEERPPGTGVEAPGLGIDAVGRDAAVKVKEGGGTPSFVT